MTRALWGFALMLVIVAAIAFRWIGTALVLWLLYPPIKWAAEWMADNHFYLLLAMVVPLWVMGLYGILFGIYDLWFLPDDDAPPKVEILPPESKPHPWVGPFKINRP